MAITFSGPTPPRVQPEHAPRFGQARRAGTAHRAHDTIHFGSNENKDAKKAQHKNPMITAMKWAALGVPLAPVTALAVLIGTLIIPPPGANFVLSCGSFFMSPLIWGTLGYLKAKAHNLKADRQAA